MRANGLDMAIASPTPSTSFTEMMASRYSVRQSSSSPARGRSARAPRRVAADFAAGLAERVRAAAQSVPAARSTSSVSAAPQMPVRRILALTTIFTAISGSADLST
jgi:hypothetical protein